MRSHSVFHGGDVVEEAEVEVGAEFAVEDVEHVLVEVGGDAGRVVVCADEDLGVLDQIGAEQQSVVAAERVGQGAVAALLGVEVAEGAAEEGQQARARLVGQSEVCFEIGHRGGNGEPGVVTADRAACLVEGGRADDQGRVATEGAVGAEGVEQQPGLAGGTGTQLDQGGGPGELGDLRGAAGEDLLLGPGRVVLRQPGDLFEQLAAPFVVEPLGRQGAWRAAQAVADIGVEGGGEMAGGQPVGEGETAFGHGALSLGVWVRGVQGDDPHADGGRQEQGAVRDFAPVTRCVVGFGGDQRGGGAGAVPQVRKATWPAIASTAS